MSNSALRCPWWPHRKVLGSGDWLGHVNFIIQSGAGRVALLVGMVTTPRLFLKILDDAFSDVRDVFV
jgi:hypothetical protein